MDAVKAEQGSSSHKIIRQVIEETRNHLTYSVPYHPETNGGIEEFFSQLKHYIKKESPNTYQDIVDCIKRILVTKIRKTHLYNFFKHLYRKLPYIHLHWCCKGFTGTVGAVKPQSSVDVDELRSSKSMDDNSICRKN